MRCQSLLLAFALAACSGGKDDDAADDTNPSPDGDADTDADADADTDTDADCDASVVSVTPADGAEDVAVDTQVVATFDAAIAATDPYEIDVAGAEGSTTLAADGLSMTWTGTLAGDTSYTVSASVCDNASSSGFSTTDKVDLTTLTGNTYALPWDTINITQPGNAAALNGFIDVAYVLAQILEVDEVSLLADAVGTTADEDPAGGPLPDCDVATVQTADFAENPFFRLDGTIAIPIDDVGNTTDLEQFSLLAKMAADGQSITDVRISGLIATEDVLENNDCVNGLLIQLLDPTCLPCTASATGQCMLFEGDAPLALLQPTLDIAATCDIQ